MRWRAPVGGLGAAAAAPDVHPRMPRRPGTPV